MPVSTPSFWLLSLSGQLEFALLLLIAMMLSFPPAVTVNGNSVAITTTGTAALSAIDTGTTLIGGPTDDVAAIWAAVPGSAASRDQQGFFEFRASFLFVLFPLSTCHCLVDLYMIDYLACSTDVTVTLSFGGKSWPISTQDMNLGQVSQGSSKCLGAIFDLTTGTNIGSGSGDPNWVVGDTFLVRFLSLFSLKAHSFHFLYQKNVYSVFRASPASVGFAQLSTLAGGSGAASTSAPNNSTVLTPTSTVTLDIGTASSSTTTSGKTNSTRFFFVFPFRLLIVSDSCFRWG